MEDKKLEEQKIETEANMVYQDSFMNRIEIGDIAVSSPAQYNTLTQLLETIKQLLKDEDIKKYLEMFKLKKLNQNYFG